MQHHILCTCWHDAAKIKKIIYSFWHGAAKINKKIIYSFLKNKYLNDKIKNNKILTKLNHHLIIQFHVSVAKLFQVTEFGIILLAEVFFYAHFIWILELQLFENLFVVYLQQTWCIHLLKLKNSQIKLLHCSTPIYSNNVLLIYTPLDL